MATLSLISNQMLDIYVINLDRRPDRLELVSEQLVNHQWERISAVDALQLNFQKLIAQGFFPDRKWRDPYNTNTSTFGEIACTLSHYKCWQLIKERNRPALICEDDFYLTSLLKKLDLSKFAEILTDFDILYLGYNEMQSDQVQIINEELIQPVYPYQTHAFCLSPIGVNKLLNFPFVKYLIAVDEFLPMAIGNEFIDCHFKTPRIKELVEIFRPYEKLKCAAFANSLSVQYYREAVGSNVCNVASLQDSETHLLTWKQNNLPQEQIQAQILNQSAEKFNLAVLNLAEQSLWQIEKNSSLNEQDILSKFGCLREYVNFHVQDDDILIFINGTDVLINDKLENIIVRFKEFDCDLLFAASKVDNGTAILKQIIANHTNSPYQYLLPNMFIAKGIAIKLFFSTFHEAMYINDFFVLNIVNLLKNEFKVLIDYENYIFQSCDDSQDDLSINQSRQICNKSTNSCNCIFQYENQDEEIFTRLANELN